MKKKRFLLGLGQALLAERVITVLTRGVDALIIFFILQEPPPAVWGAVWAFVYMTPVNLAFCVGIVLVNDALCAMGLDVLRIETLRAELEHATLERRHFVRRAARRILRSRGLIFWVGSWFYLDPDYVTLLLRRKEEGYARTFMWLTLPSVVLCMAVWVPIYWLAVQGYWWAVWLVE